MKANDLPKMSKCWFLTSRLVDLAKGKNNSKVPKENDEEEYTKHSWLGCLLGAKEMD